MAFFDPVRSVATSEVLKTVLEQSLPVGTLITKQDDRFVVKVKVGPISGVKNIYDEDVTIDGILVSTSISIPLSSFRPSFRHYDSDGDNYEDDKDDEDDDSDDINFNTRFSITLIDATGEYQYVSKIGYMGSKIFFNMNEVVTEIKRLLGY
jgi:hypothetical protein